MSAKTPEPTPKHGTARLTNPDNLLELATDTGYALIGMTDLAMARAREVGDSMRQAAAALPAHARSLPETARTFTKETAGEVEHGFDELAGRGKAVVDRMSGTSAPSDLLEQGRATIAKGMAAFSTMRRSAAESVKAGAGTVIGEAQVVATEVEESVSQAPTTPDVKRATDATRKTAPASRTAVKSAASSAKKSAAKADKATDEAEQVGD